MVKMAGAIRGVGQARKAGFALEERLKSAPVARGVNQAASTREVQLLDVQLYVLLTYKCH